MLAVTDDDALLPQVPSPEDVIVMVAGGPGKHSAVVPNCTFSRAVSRPITPIPGWRPVRVTGSAPLLCPGSSCEWSPARCGAPAPRTARLPQPGGGSEGGSEAPPCGRA